MEEFSDDELSNEGMSRRAFIVGFVAALAPPLPARSGAPVTAFTFVHETIVTKSVMTAARRSRRIGGVARDLRGAEVGGSSPVDLS